MVPNKGFGDSFWKGNAIAITVVSIIFASGSLVATLRLIEPRLCAVELDCKKIPTLEADAKNSKESLNRIEQKLDRLIERR